MNDEIPEDLTTLSHGELNDLIRKLEGEAGDINEQLSKAKLKAYSDGVYSDSDWFIRANGALRFKKKHIQRIQGEFARRKGERWEEARRKEELRKEERRKEENRPKPGRALTIVSELPSGLSADGIQEYLNSFSDRRFRTFLQYEGKIMVIWSAILEDS